MLCCATLALAASTVVAAGRRLGFALLVAGGTLIDPAALLGHATVWVCRG